MQFIGIEETIALLGAFGFARLLDAAVGEPLAFTGALGHGPNCTPMRCAERQAMWHARVRISALPVNEELSANNWTVLTAQCLRDLVVDPLKLLCEIGAAHLNGGFPTVDDGPELALLCKRQGIIGQFYAGLDYLRSPCGKELFRVWHALSQSSAPHPAIKADEWVKLQRIVGNG